MALRMIGRAAHFFLSRHWERSWVGPYMVTTVEVRPSAYETSVTWGEGGPQVEQFGSGLAFDRKGAVALHEEICSRAEAELGLDRHPALDPRSAA